MPATRGAGNIPGCPSTRSPALCAREPGAVRRPRIGMAEKRGGWRTLLRLEEVRSLMLSTDKGGRRARSPRACQSLNGARKKDLGWLERADENSEGRLCP
jgi:hypothetical protein